MEETGKYMDDVAIEVKEVVATLRIVGMSLVDKKPVDLDIDNLSDCIMGQANHLERITYSIQA